MICWCANARSCISKIHRAPLSLPRVIYFKFSCSRTRNVTSHSMENLAFHSLLRWKMIIIPNSHYVTYTFLFKRLGECTFYNSGVKGPQYPPPCQSQLSLGVECRTECWSGGNVIEQKSAENLQAPINRYWCSQWTGVARATVLIPDGISCAHSSTFPSLSWSGCWESCRQWAGFQMHPCTDSAPGAVSTNVKATCDWLMKFLETLWWGKENQRINIQPQYSRLC